MIFPLRLLAPGWLIAAGLLLGGCFLAGDALAAPPGPNVITGPQTFTKKWKLVEGQTIDARQARWSGNEKGWAVQIVEEKLPGITLLGPTIDGPLDLEKVEDWETFHASAGIYLQGLPKVVVRGATVGNIGDGIRIRQGCDDWTVEGCHIRSAGDDAIENDDLLSGRIVDTLVERAHVGISLRPARDDEATIDGSQNVLEVRDTLIRLVPQKATRINNGFVTSHGGFFKFWTREGSTGRRIQLKITNCVFCAEALPYTGDLSLNPMASVIEAEGNTIVWLGTGPFPENAPTGWTATRDKAVWDNAVAKWKSSHAAANAAGKTR